MKKRVSESGGEEPQAWGEFLLYTAEDGRTRIDCRFDGHTIWLTQAQIADLFQTTPQNITLHLKAIFAEGELDEAATCKDYLQVRFERSRGHAVLSDHPEQVALGRHWPHGSGNHRGPRRPRPPEHGADRMERREGA